MGIVITRRGSIAAAKQPSVPTNPPQTPAFTQITVQNDVATHEFTPVADATLYRIETEKVG